MREINVRKNKNGIFKFYCERILNLIFNFLSLGIYIIYTGNNISYSLAYTLLSLNLYISIYTEN